MKIVLENLRWILAVWIAFVFIQSLFFKFSGSYETQYIFGTLGEWSGFAWFAAYGAYGVGITELIASILLFTRFYGFGALLALGVMSGAIYFHLFIPLGIVMPSFDAEGNITGYDGGTLFIMACITWATAGFLAFKEWQAENSLLRALVAK